MTVRDQNLDEAPYVEMTKELIKIFPHSGGTFAVEADASSGSYFIAANWLLREFQPKKSGFPSLIGTGLEPAQAVIVRGWPTSVWQVDARFPRYWPLPQQVSRERDLGDSIMTAMAVAPLGAQPVQFTDLGRLRVQECERVHALRTELSKCGATVIEAEETLTVYPSQMHGTEIDTYQDHRMAMCFATLGLKVPGLRLQNPACVKKTFPNFFQKLAAPPPSGLGITLLDPVTGRKLDWNELLAD